MTSNPCPQCGTTNKPGEKQCAACSAVLPAQAGIPEWHKKTKVELLDAWERRDQFASAEIESLHDQLVKRGLNFARPRRKSDEGPPCTCPPRLNLKNCLIVGIPLLLAGTLFFVGTATCSTDNGVPLIRCTR